MTKAVRVQVSGEVQGVSFRGYAAREAVRLELRGWVRNTDDGDVLLHVEGPSSDVDEMVAWCLEGSPEASVEEVDVAPDEPTAAATFEVRY
ncbi:acylphosphatase [Phycicoccus flavus]|uniref:Acylphosphatase n=1 Tax=Phycicoccus flavus TaxID=2502783 RepID=A0A8T6R5C6_9MICO|nr:acylphosphatase [Phycicoccus flavus]NHA68874.1 acylphosphatase [Phycicoccus flavus]